MAIRTTSNKNGAFVSRKGRFVSNGFLRSLRADTGETLVETLVSVLIVSAVFLMLCTAVVTAAKINTTVVATDTVFDSSKKEDLPENSVVVTIKQKNGTETVERRPDGKKMNGYVYYDVD